MRRFDLHQKIARTKSMRLIAWMSLMQILTVLLCGAVIGYVAAFSGMFMALEQVGNYPFLTVFLVVAAIVMPVVSAIIIAGAVYQFHELKEGGSKIARLLNAQQIPPSNANRSQQQLLNVVQEMAISSGIPAPPVYIMLGESGINALAAGHTAADAVLVVTEGAIRTLTRDQMQGVVAHEFSHILNGDIKRNMWLMSFTHGNYCVCLTAQWMIEYDASEMNFMAIILFNCLGYVLYPPGILGAFLALLFTARIKRHGEYNADATAVELTRLPDGLSQALLRIGGNREKGRIRNSKAFEAAHLFFADSGWSFASMFDSHPPLDHRVIRLMPDWDGYYLYESEEDLGDYTGVYHDVSTLVGVATDAMGSSKRDEFLKKAALTAATLVATGADSTLTQAIQSGEENGLEDDESEIDGTVPAWIACQSPALPEIKPVLLELANAPQGAGLILAALRLSQFEPPQAEKYMHKVDPAISVSLRQLSPNIVSLDDGQKLLLFDRSLEALQTAPAIIRNLLLQFVRQTSVNPDHETCLTRWAWQRILSSKLQGGKRPSARYGNLEPLMPLAVTLFSAFVYADWENVAAGRYTLMRAKSRIGLDGPDLVARDACTVESVDESLEVLGYLAARERRRLILALGSCVTSNREINTEEAWLIRAVCDGLHYPSPSMFPGQPVTPGA